MLHAGTAGTAKQERPAVGAVGLLALGEGRLAQQIEAVVQDRVGAGVQRRGGERALTPIEPPSVDVRGQQSAFCRHHQRRTSGREKSRKRWPC